MPAEAIHLSALEDTLRRAAPALQRRVREPRLREAARLGAVFVDLPYFERFSRVLLRYLLKRPQAPSPWGDRLHQAAPIALGRRLAEAGARLQRSSDTREAGDVLVALALGYFSHAAIDTALHPLINRLASDRAAALGDAVSRQHHEVEKFQSVLFHRDRLGFDFLGTATLRALVTIQATPILRPGPIAEALQAGARAVLGQAPGAPRLADWVRGYGVYAALISGPGGKTIAPRALQDHERPGLYDAVDFPGRYAAAVARSRAWVAALVDYLDDGRFDPSAQAALLRAVPEGTLDPGPEPPPPQATP